MGNENKDILCISEMHTDFIECLKNLAFQKAVSLIIMGITGKTGISDFFVGSNTIKMIDRNVCPVMIVPADSEYKEIKQIALTCDFNGVECDSPTIFIKNILEFFNPSLHIVNVSSDHYIYLTEEYQQKCKKLELMFKGYKPDFYFIGMYDFYDSIENFVKDKNIDLIVTIPKYHSFFDKVFKGSHTKKLALHSKVSMLAAHA